MKAKTNERLIVFVSFVTSFYEFNKLKYEIHSCRKLILIDFVAMLNSDDELVEKLGSNTRIIANCALDRWICFGLYILSHS